MTAARRTAIIGAVLFAVAAILTVILVLHNLRDRSPAGVATRPKPASQDRASDTIGGLAATGAGPVLSWTRLDNATTYHVMASGPQGRWMWGGYSSKVLFGTLETDTDPVVRPDLPEVRVLVPKPGETYHWAVIAFSDKGDVVATSEIQSFTYTPPAGAALPPRSPRHTPPALACSKLIPEPLAAKLFPGFAMHESTPCGGVLSGGCPLTCEYVKRSDDETTRASFTFSCADGDWAGHPKPEHGAPLSGVGRAAQVAVEDDDTTILFQSTSTKCIVSQRSAMSREASIAIAKAIDAQLVPGSMWMADD
ncbi:MAG TPA: hypothetical protein VIV58_11695 [Kofleriaceae bacterium]